MNLMLEIEKHMCYTSYRKQVPPADGWPRFQLCQNDRLVSQARAVIFY